MCRQPFSYRSGLRFYLVIGEYRRSDNEEVPACVISPAGSTPADAVYRTLASRSLHDQNRARLRRDFEDHTTAGWANAVDGAAVGRGAVEVAGCIHDNTRIGVGTVRVASDEENLQGRT